MGLLGSLAGNASEIDVIKISDEFGEILSGDEHLEKAYEVFRDFFLFTDLRLILVDKQGLTGSRELQAGRSIDSIISVF